MASEIIIKNRDYLDPLIHIEDKPSLVYEREEVSDIKHRIRSWFTKEGPAFVTLIGGSSGSGKTLSLSYSLLEYVKENPEISWIWVDGNQSRTPLTLLRKICSSLGGRIESRSTSSDLLSMIRELLLKKDKETLIVIDEVEKIYYNSRETPKYWFLQSLMRLDVKPRLSFFFITNEFNFVKNLASEVTGGMNQIIFPSYNASDLYEILIKRARFCLNKKVYTENDMAKIAKEVYQNPMAGNQANARKAIEILAIAANLAQKKKEVLASVLDKSIIESRLEDYKSLLNKYNRSLQLLIKTLATMWKDIKKDARGLKKYDNPIFTYQAIEEHFFEVIKKEGCKELSGKSLRSYIDTLVRDNVLSRFGKGKYYFIEDADSIINAFSKIY